MVHSKNAFRRTLAKGLMIASALMLVMADVQARPAKGGSAGNRGTRTEMAPPTTNTAPRQAQPISGPQNPSAQAPRAAAPTPAAQPSRWSGLMGGIAGGLLGAGLFGLLSGSGLFGGLGGLGSILGLIVQAAILFFVIRFAIGYFRRRQMQPAVAGMPNQFARQPDQPRQTQPEWQPQHAASAPAAPPAMPELALGEADFNAFERLLGEIQLAYGKEDRVSLTQRVTPQMGNLFNDELNEMMRQGITNRISDVKLLQGDLAEAWREPEAEYATVAMRYALVDVKVERTSGRIVEGDPKTPQEVVENWTFTRAPGETDRDWKLSAIQQA